MLSTHARRHIGSFTNVHTNTVVAQNAGPGAARTRFTGALKKKIKKGAKSMRLGFVTAVCLERFAGNCLYFTLKLRE